MVAGVYAKTASQMGGREGTQGGTWDLKKSINKMSIH